MKLLIPFKDWFITQLFGANENTYYAEDGLKGHTGVDIASGLDRTIYCSHAGYVYSHQNRDNPDLMRYRAVYTLIEDAGVFYELSYGHVLDIYAEIGSTVAVGDRIAQEGNTGDVASGGKKVTAEQKKNGSLAGSHLHFQLRLVRPVSIRDARMTYLMDANGFFKRDGKYFERVPNPGYADCIDPMPFIVLESAAPSTPIVQKITVTLRYGDGKRTHKEEQVKLLQALLHIDVDGSFGTHTLEAVKVFQHAHNLVADGVVGKLTTDALYKMVH